MSRPPYNWPDPDRDYANGAFIPGSAIYPELWARKAAAFREGRSARSELDLSYGSGARQKLDLFLPDAKPLGVIIFIHGGYWHLFSKSHWSHLAAGPLSLGFAVAIPGYTLAPAARISEITSEIARAAWFVGTRLPGKMVITGHSAGGHLAARMASTDIVVPVDRVIPISPLVELGPLMGTSMNATLAIDDDEAARESPARLVKRPEVAVRVWVGASERPAFLWQARVLAEAWDCPWTAEPGRHHFDVIEGMEDPNSSLTQALISGL